MTFSQLGGHSLLVMRLVAQINDIFQCELPLITLFKYPTVEQLADFMLADEHERQRIELTADFILGRDTTPDEKTRMTLLVAMTVRPGLRSPNSPTSRNY